LLLLLMMMMMMMMMISEYTASMLLARVLSTASLFCSQ
jgi:hypothetical protein